MTAREKAYWLRRVNPYNRPHLQTAFKEGARQYWSGRRVGILAYTATERAAFWKGYEAAQELPP